MKVEGDDQGMYKVRRSFKYSDANCILSLATHCIVISYNLRL